VRSDPGSSLSGTSVDLSTRKDVRRVGELTGKIVPLQESKVCPYRNEAMVSNQLTYQIRNTALAWLPWNGSGAFYKSRL